MKEKEKTKLFESIKEEYIYYLNLIIKDETNPDLLLYYLSFLKNNEKNLENLNLPHEKFKDELEYYSIFFEKDKLYELFEYTKESEKIKMINLLKDYSNSIRNKTFKVFQNKIIKEYKRRYFNQPISFEFNELIYYDCNTYIYNDIIDYKNKEKNLEDKSYMIEVILRSKIIENCEQTLLLIPLIYLILQPERGNIQVLLNIIESKNLSKEESNKNLKIYNDELKN